MEVDVKEDTVKLLTRTKRTPRIDFCERCGSASDEVRRAEIRRDRALDRALRLGPRI